MGWGDPKSLKFDISELTRMRKQLDQTAKDLTDYSKKLTDYLEKLKKEWKTPAGKAFMNNVDVDWISQTKKYVKVIEAVEKMLQEAETNYRQVENCVQKLSF